MSTSQYAVTDPHDGNVVETYPTADASDVSRALDAVSSAYKSWSRTTSVADRAALMKRASELFSERTDELAARRDKAGLSVPPRNLQAVADSNVGADEEVEGRQEEP